MTTMKRMMVVMVVAAMSFGFFTTHIQAASESTIAVSNMIGTGFTTLISGLINGRVKSIGDGLEMFLYGGAAGYGFYQSKKLVANGSIPLGMVLANLSASVSENAAMKENPLAYINLTWAFARVRIATPLASNARSTIGIDISSREIVNLALSIANSDKVSFRDGMLSFESTNMYRNALGWNRGMFATTVTGTPEMVYRHEMVHVVQNMQLSSQNFYEPFLNFESREEEGRNFFSFQGLRVDAMGIANDLLMGLQSYESQWKEVEAYHFSGR